MITVSTDELRAMLTDLDPEIRWKAWMLVLQSVAGYPDGAAEAPDELGDRLAIALGLPAGHDLPRFTTEQAGEKARVTCMSCTRDTTGPEASHAVPTAQCARVSALVALLGSRHERVLHRAVQELAELGPGVAGVLRTVRRSRTPSRRGALTALAEISWHELDPADRDLLTRFLRNRPPTHPLFPKVLRELPWPWNILASQRERKLAELQHTQANEQAALDALNAVLSDLPSTPRSGVWSRESWELYDRFCEEAGHPLAQLRRWHDLLTQEDITEVLRGWARTTESPVPDWLIDQQADQIAGAWAHTMLGGWVLDVLRWLGKEPRDVQRLAAVAERCIANDLATDDAVNILGDLGAPHGEQVLLRVVRDNRVDEPDRAWARERLGWLRRPGHDARGQQPPEGEEPLLPPAVQQLLYGWGSGFMWPDDLPETEENIARARAILEACAPTRRAPVPVPAPSWHGYEDEERPAWLEVRTVMRNLMPYPRQVTRERMTEAMRECALLTIPGVPQDPDSEEAQRFGRQWVTWISGWIADEVFRWLGRCVNDSAPLTPWAMELAEQYLHNGVGREQAMWMLRWHHTVPRSREALTRLAADHSLPPELRKLAGSLLKELP